MTTYSLFKTIMVDFTATFSLDLLTITADQKVATLSEFPNGQLSFIFS